MIPDVKYRDFYLHYINRIKVKLYKANNKLNNTIIVKDELYKYISDNKSIIKSKFNVDLDDYIEYTNKTITNDNSTLYRKVLSILKTITNEHRELIIKLTKYCNILITEHNCNEYITKLNKCVNIKYKTYEKYVNSFSNKIHECVLNGMGYKFSHGIGTLVINRWKLNGAKPIIDFAATNARRKEFEAKNLELWDKNKEAWYKARNIPYTPADYRVYKNYSYYYEITFIQSNIFNSRNLDYKYPNYTHKKYRGLSYKEVADKFCKTDEDIYNLNADIKFKLNIYLYKNPIKYLNYVRTADELKYKYRKNHCEN